MKKVSISLFQVYHTWLSLFQLGKILMASKILSLLLFINVIYHLSLLFILIILGLPKPLWLNLAQVNDVYEYTAETCTLHPCLMICP